MRAFAVALLLAASALSSETRADPVVPASLQGEWTTDCLPIGQGGRHGMISRLEIDGSGRMSAWSQVFASNALSVTHRVGTLLLKTNQDEVTAIYNDTKKPAGCGLTGWQTNIARPVDGRTCAVFDLPETGDMLLDRAWVDGTRLTFGSYPLKWTIRSKGNLPSAPGPVSFYRTGY